jgi:hypothetical protein
MNRNYAIAAALAFAAAGSALADDITIDPNPFVSTATRAQVREDLMKYRTAGVNPWADEYNQLAPFRSAKTRTEVQAEFLASRDEVAAFTAEDSGSMYIARMTMPHLRRSTELAHK